MEFKITIPTDSEGYYSLECPYCNEKFKVLAGDIDEEETIELFCPYCGLIKDNSSFIPNAVIEHAQTLAMNYLKQQLNKSFSQLNKTSKRSGITFDFNKLKEEQPNLLIEDESLEIIELQCCNKTIKIQPNHTFGNIYCPFCGGN